MILIRVNDHFCEEFGRQRASVNDEVYVCGMLVIAICESLSSGS